MITATVFILYCMQLAYFLSMQILEYKAGIWESCKEIYRMTTGKIFFLCKILLLQILIAACVLTILYFGLGTVIAVIMPIISWFFEILQLQMAPMLVYMLYNFFYLWSYLLLYVWVCLVTAHVYRQLVCPPIDNASCASCTSCEK